MEKQISHFLCLDTSVGYGKGKGDGSGDGSESGKGYGNGYGYGNGSGNGSGDGSGNGCGSGYGSECGDGSGKGYGSGYGDVKGSGDGSGDGSRYVRGSGDGFGSRYGNNIQSINGLSVYEIDNLPTIITSIKLNVAKGFILGEDLTLISCFIVKRKNLFAHGYTIRQAVKDIEEKLYDYMDIEEIIEMFLQEFAIDQKYPAMKFFDWHNKLTTSCELGRKTFAKNHNINLHTDKFTIDEFIELTKNDYGGEIIRKLEEIKNKKGKEK